jgi:hypothetical protein
MEHEKRQEGEIKRSNQAESQPLRIQLSSSLFFCCCCCAKLSKHKKWPAKTKQASSSFVHEKLPFGAAAADRSDDFG